MLRVWALAAALVGAALVGLILVGFVGTTALLYAAPVGGAGAAAAYLPNGVSLNRAIWLFVGVLGGAAGFGIGALFFPDNNWGLFLGAAVPAIILAIITMWTRDELNFLTSVIGAGALAGFYATTFNLDPQGLTYDLPIVMGQVTFVLGLGYLAGALVKTFLPQQAEAAQDTTDDAPVEVNA